MFDVMQLAPWIGGIVAAISLVISLRNANTKAVSDKIEKVEGRVDAVEDRVIRVEGCIVNLPDKDSTHRMEQTITELKGDLKVIAERVQPIAAIANRIQEFLMDQVKPR